MPINMETAVRLIWWKCSVATNNKPKNNTIIIRRAATMESTIFTSMHSFSPEKGAANGARTRDPWLGKPMLYQLSYCRLYKGWC